MSNVNTFGLEIVRPKPLASSAVISAFNTADPVFFNIPIPLVAFCEPKFVILSNPPPNTAVVEAIPAVPELVPINPPTTSSPLL